MGVPKNDFGAPLYSPEPRTGAELIVSTHDFCDPTTWYCTSARVESQALTDSGDGLTWTSPHSRWIDLTHGKVWDEDAICEDVEHGYAVVVTVDGVAVTQRTPFAISGGDYIVDYAAGSVTFTSPVTGPVLASYSRAVDSTFVLAPDAGYQINVESAEADFSTDVVMNDTVDFEVWAYNPDDLPNKIRVKKTCYKRMRNFRDESLASFPLFPTLGGTARGTRSDSVCLQFRNGTIRALLSSQGVELRVKLRNDLAFGGEHATATFYCTVREEMS